MSTSKQQIIDAGISGLPIKGEDVASLNPKGYLTLRHAWPDDLDGRAWHAIKRAYVRYGQTIADATGKTIPVLSKQGWQIDEIEPR
jgi:hypothetical protein